MFVSRHFLVGTLAVALGMALSLPAVAQEESPANYNISQQRAAVAKSERIMAEATRRKGLLAQFLYMRDTYSTSDDYPFRVIFNQYVSWYQTWVGDYNGARATFSIASQAAADDNESPLQGGYQAQSAVDVIAKLAKGRQAVFLNEAHSNALTRTVTVQVLERLRAEGFDTFAAETLYDTDKGLAERGFADSSSGFYTEEPIYAEMIRTALRLGFKVVPYEAVSNATGNERELEQARNLIAATLKKDPKARIVVNAGFAHIQKAGTYLGGKSMAQHFERLSGIEPLSIEQTMMVPHLKSASDHPWYRAIMATKKPGIPVIYVDSNGEPWSLKKEGYDVSVVFPPEVYERERPTWLALGGLRVPYQVSGALCSLNYPCLVEARYKDEDDSAIPADRAVISIGGNFATIKDSLNESTSTLPLRTLWLRPGEYRLVAKDIDDRILTRRNVSVTVKGGSAP